MKTLVISFEPTAQVDTQFVADLVRRLLAVYEVKVHMEEAPAQLSSAPKLGYDVQLLRDAKAALDAIHEHVNIPILGPFADDGTRDAACRLSIVRPQLQNVLKDIDGIQG